MKRRNLSIWLTAVAMVAAVSVFSGVLIASDAAEEAAPKLGDIADGGRAEPVHLITLFGPEGEEIDPDGDPAMPISLSKTCGECHSVDQISCGWHFNATDPCVPAGERRQPWIQKDYGTATQLPISYRDWKGTFNPDEIGMSRWKFVQAFGKHLPGGVNEDLDAEEPDFDARWEESGPLEVNCFICHLDAAEMDHAEYAAHVTKENYRWAATGSSGLAIVTGAAKKMPEMFDYIMPMVEGPKLLAAVPTVHYDKSRFLEGKKVFLNLKREVSEERCYFCHSSADMTAAGHERWKLDEDIHMKSGMTCVDCHRNGLDHMITRNYDGEEAAKEDPMLATLSCKGCHMGSEESETPVAGRMSAPMPTHPGIPTIHFKKLSCTACHSGPWPEKETHVVKTSRAHGLGTRGVNKSEEALPHIQEPVFTERADGTIAPHKLFWPSFWGHKKDNVVSAMTVSEVTEYADGFLVNPNDDVDNYLAGNWSKLTKEQITSILDAIGNDDEKGNAIYVGGGKVYQLNDAGELQVAEHEAAEPYTWAFAHDVRPASQSLGVRGCSDCHTTDAPFFFGEVAVNSPVEGEGGTVTMASLQSSVDESYIWAFNKSFMFRVMMKTTVIICAIIFAGLILLYGLKGLGALSKAAAGDGAEK